MKYRASFAVFSLGLSLTALAGESPKTGTIVGSIRFVGEVPPVQKILTSDGATLLHHDLVVDAKTKGLRFVIVALDKAPVGQGKSSGPVVVDQRDMVFLPRVVAIQEGQKVRFENNDLCNHGVQAVSAKSENTFNVNTPSGQPFDFEFKAQKTPVMIGCPIHAWMRAWVFVSPHPFFAVTDARGQFKIANVPPGKHTLLLTHPDTGMKEQRFVEIIAGKTAELAVEWNKIAK